MPENRSGRSVMLLAGGSKEHSAEGKALTQQMAGDSKQQAVLPVK
jgi:hypothetical protein